MFKSIFLSRKLNVFLKIIALLNILAAFALIISYLSTFIDPRSFWPVAFFGLSFPVFSLINSAFFLFWLLLRNKMMLVSLFVFIAGFNHHRHFLQITFSSGPLEENSEKIKILTWNVRLFDLYNWEHNKKTRDSIFRVVQRENPDIICFQEFYHTDRKNIFTTRDTLVKILRAKNFHEGYTHKLKHEQYFGVATFSAFPIIFREEIRFENDDNNNVICTDVVTRNDTLRIYNAHLSSIRFQRGDYEYIGDTTNSKKWLYPGQKTKPEKQNIISRLKSAFYKRAEQTEILMRHIAKSPHPVILAGDFNDTPVSYFYRLVTNHLTDSFVLSGNGIGSTYIGKFPSFRIDYIFHSNDLNSFDYKTLQEELSDHHAVSCSVEI